MMAWVPAQRDREELLDLGAGTAAERRQSLRDLRRLNRCLGGIAASRRELAILLAGWRGTDVTLLDLGTGSADVPAGLRAWARQRGIDLRSLAIDLKLEHLREARDHS